MENNIENAGWNIMPLSAGDGTEDNPFIISDVEGFLAISDNLNAYYRLEADIDFSGGQITPAGAVAVPFKGGLDGNGHRIKNFVIETVDSYTGIFRYATTAKFKDLILENGEIRQPPTVSYAGALAGYMNNCTAENITLIDIVVSGGSYIGIMAGTVSGSVKGCSARGTKVMTSGTQITGNSNIGGLVGSLSAGSITHCYADVKVTGTGNDIGGLVGSVIASTKINECYATGDVTGNAYIGGLAGTARAVVSDSFATGKVTSTYNGTSAAYTGGLIGYATYSSIKNCFSAGKVSARGSGLVYASSGTTVVSSCFDSAAAGVMIFDSYNIGKLTTGMMYKESYIGWNFESIWEIEEGNTYPYLKNVDVPEDHRNDSSTQPQGKGTEAEPYLVNDVKQFECIGYDLSSCYKLGADIDFQGETATTAGTGQIPFKGTLDGDGYSIRNFQISRTDSNVGLFRYAVEAKFKNLILDGGFIASTSYSIGALVGLAEGCTMENINLIDITVSGGMYCGALAGCTNEGNITGCSVKGRILISGKEQVGGLLGKASKTDISYCQVAGTGTVTGTDSGTGNYIGGLIGEMSEGTIKHCYTDINAEGVDYIGGLIGKASGAKNAVIKECYASGSVTGRAYIGGLMGHVSADISNSYASGSVTATKQNSYIGGLAGYTTSTNIKNCYALGRINSGSSGLVNIYNSTTVTSSYFDSIATGINAGDQYNVGKLTTVLIKKEIYAGWDFDNIWDMEEGVTYPYLRSLAVSAICSDDTSLFPVGLGTEENPYLISNVREFEYIRYDLSGYYKLTSDIDFNGIAITPIGSSRAQFWGVLDGDGYAIKNFKISTKADYTGLFSYTSAAHFKNLIISKGEILPGASYSYTGALAGYINGGITENISLMDITISGGRYCGALAGYAGRGEILRCFVRENVLVSGSGMVGGLVGEASYNSVKCCYGVAKIQGGNNTGGLIGNTNSVNINQCYAAGNISGTVYVGGLVGYARGIFHDSFATGRVISTTNSMYTGGFTGYAVSSDIKNCYAACTVSAEGSGLVAYVYHSTTIADSYYDSKVTGVAARNTYGVGKLTKGLMQKTGYTDWDFDNIWDIDHGKTYPFLQGLDMPIGHSNTTEFQPEGSGTQEDPYLIETSKEFENIRYECAGYYRLIADIDFQEHVIIPTGTRSVPFAGVFDGNGYAIRNFKISNTDSYAGLFGCAESAIVKDLTIESGEVTQPGTVSYAGALAGYLTECVTENIMILDAVVSGGKCCGALSGYVDGGSVTGCYGKGNTLVTGTENVGGLVGEMKKGKIRRCYTAIETEGTKYTGGLIGYVSGYSNEINECYVVGSIRGKEYVGGLIGYAQADISDSFTVGSVTSTTNHAAVGGLIGNVYSAQIKRCYAAGQVSAGGSGLIYNSRATVTDSYYDNLAAGITRTSAINVGKLTVALMRKQFYTGWDFDNIWCIEEETTYPYLRGLERPAKHSNDISGQPKGTGTEEDPYLISNRKEYDFIRYDLTGCYKLVTDIDFHNESVKPIASSAEPFSGTLDGDGYAIKNFKVVATNTSVGLFQYAAAARIKDLIIENAEIIQDARYSQIGALAGYLDNCITENISLIDISVSGGKDCAALAGCLNGGSLRGCFVRGNIMVNGTTQVGGLVGRLSNAEVNGCWAESTGIVSGTGPVGGLIGEMTGSTITYCYANIKTEAVNSAGGLIGATLTSSSTVSECYAIGNVTGNLAGGLIGSATAISVNDCYATGIVISKANNKNTGGLIGYANATTVKNCYAACTVSTNGSGLTQYGSITNSYFDSTISGITTPTTQARTTAQMLNKGTYSVWNWTNIWRAQDGAYPALRNTIVPPHKIPFALTLHENTFDSFIIEWPDIPKATEYEVTYGNKVEKSLEPRIVIADLNPGVEYELRVRAKVGTAMGVWSRTLKIKIKNYPMVDGIHTTAKDINSITLTWNQVEDAQEYEVRCNNEVVKTADTICTVRGLYPAIPYAISVRAILTDGSIAGGNPIIEKLYTLNPQTDYAREFINHCQNQTWFIDEIENLLNMKGKSINTIHSPADFNAIYAIRLANRGISGKIPAAIGQLHNLRYLYLANNDLSGDLPDELMQLEKIITMDLSGNHFS